MGVVRENVKISGKYSVINAIAKNNNLTYDRALSQKTSVDNIH